MSDSEAVKKSSDKELLFSILHEIMKIICFSSNINQGNIACNVGKKLEMRILQFQLTCLLNDKPRISLDKVLER